MAKRKNKNSRPAREPQPAPINPLLGPDEQSARYRVCGFALQPELEILVVVDGKDVVKHRKRAARAIAVFEADFDSTIRQVMAEAKAKMESHPK